SDRPAACSEGPVNICGCGGVHRRTPLQYRLRCALGHEQPATVAPVDEHGHQPAYMIERSDRHPAVLLHGLVLRVSRLPQGDVESIAGHGNALLNGGFITEESEQQHLLRWASL